MAGRSLNVNLNVIANTTSAIGQLKSLQSQLSSLQNLSKLDLSVKGEGLSQALKQVSEFNSLLSQSKTALGGLDISKFQYQLKSQGKDIADYGAAFGKLGADGASSFKSITKTMLASQDTIKKTGGLLNSLGNSLMNSVKFQVFNGIVRGVSSTVSGAFSYAEKLNDSLNNIRIVTGQSTQQMAAFAKEANAAAQSLSSTTTAYTNASLIYYQQGLKGNAVKERTDVTVQMANVTGQTAAKVSDQMTAIWNNFDNGSKSLAYYGDVMAALGAKTAASSSEIATGLERFAAVSNTVGLSYEYATSALATVVAETRQSADSVGTSFRTLFSRLEGLNLGETLDDGTTLNKYSTALAKVGVNIKNSTGELKDMDTILDELGEKWETLGQAEKVALAQTVGGARQYTTLISLMDKWDVFKENLNTAKTSEGTLKKQQDIYAQSWEAANKRVRASMESLYSDLINDDFMIGLTNLGNSFVKGLQNGIKGFGGVQGLLSTAGNYALLNSGDKIGRGIDNGINNVKYAAQRLGGKTEADISKQNIEKMTQAYQDARGQDKITDSERVMLQNTMYNAQMNAQYMKQKENMTPEQQAAYETAAAEVKKAQEAQEKAYGSAEGSTATSQQYVEDAKRARRVTEQNSPLDGQAKEEADKAWEEQADALTRGIIKSDIDVDKAKKNFDRQTFYDKRYEEGLQNAKVEDSDFQSYIQDYNKTIASKNSTIKQEIDAERRRLSGSGMTGKALTKASTSRVRRGFAAEFLQDNEAYRKATPEEQDSMITRMVTTGQLGFKKFEELTPQQQQQWKDTWESKIKDQKAKEWAEVAVGHDKEGIANQDNSRLQEMKNRAAEEARENAPDIVIQQDSRQGIITKNYSDRLSRAQQDIDQKQQEYNRALESGIAPDIDETKKALEASQQSYQKIYEQSQDKNATILGGGLFGLLSDASKKFSNEVKDGDEKNSPLSLKDILEKSGIHAEDNAEEGYTRDEKYDDRLKAFQQATKDYFGEDKETLTAGELRDFLQAQQQSSEQFLRAAGIDDAQSKILAGDQAGNPEVAAMRKAEADKRLEEAKRRQQELLNQKDTMTFGKFMQNTSKALTAGSAMYSQANSLYQNFKNADGDLLKMDVGQSLSSVSGILSNAVMAMSQLGPIAGGILTAVSVLGPVLWDFFDGLIETESERLDRLKEENQAAHDYVDQEKENQESHEKNVNSYLSSFEKQNESFENVTEAIKNRTTANEQARQVIEDYNLSFDDYEYNAQGYIEINKQKLAEAQKAEAQRVEAAQSAAVISDMSLAANLAYSSKGGGIGEIMAGQTSSSRHDVATTLLKKEAEVSPTVAMGKIGGIIGGLLGLAFGGPAGAVLGATLGATTLGAVGATALEGTEKVDEYEVTRGVYKEKYGFDTLTGKIDYNKFAEAMKKAEEDDDSSLYDMDKYAQKIADYYTSNGTEMSKESVLETMLTDITNGTETWKETYKQAVFSIEGITDSAIEYANTYNAKDGKISALDQIAAESYSSYLQNDAELSYVLMNDISFVKGSQNNNDGAELVKSKDNSKETITLQKMNQAQIRDYVESYLGDDTWYDSIKMSGALEGKNEEEQLTYLRQRATAAIRQKENEEAYRRVWEDTQEDLKETELGHLSFTEMSAQQMQKAVEQLEGSGYDKAATNFRKSIAATTSGWVSQLSQAGMTFQNTDNAIRGMYSTWAATGMSSESFTEMNDMISQMGQTFGGDAASLAFSYLTNGGEGGYNASALNELLGIDWSSGLNSMTQLDDLISGSLARGDLNAAFYSGLKEEGLRNLGGSKGLLEELYKAEDFTDTLTSLQSEFKKTGKVSAKAIQSAAKSCTSLNKYLSVTGTSAAGLAAIMEDIMQGEVRLSDLSSASVAAYSAANKDDEIATEQYDYIDNYENARSVTELQGFYKGLGDKANTAMKAGLFYDESVHDYFKEVWSEEDWDTYRKSMDAIMNNGDLTEEQKSQQAEEEARKWFNGYTEMVNSTDGANIGRLIYDQYDKRSGVKGLMKELGWEIDEDGTFSGIDLNSEKLEELGGTEEKFIESLMKAGLSEHQANSWAMTLRASSGLGTYWDENQKEEAKQQYKGNKQQIYSKQELDNAKRLGYIDEDDYDRLIESAYDAKTVGNSLNDKVNSKSDDTPITSQDFYNTFFGQQSSYTTEEIQAFNKELFGNENLADIGYEKFAEVLSQYNVSAESIYTLAKDMGVLNTNSVKSQYGTSLAKALEEGGVLDGVTFGDKNNQTAEDYLKTASSDEEYRERLAQVTERLNAEEYASFIKTGLQSIFDPENLQVTINSEALETFTTGMNEAVQQMLGVSAKEGDNETLTGGIQLFSTETQNALTSLMTMFGDASTPGGISLGITDTNGAFVDLAALATDGIGVTLNDIPESIPINFDTSALENITISIANIDEIQRDLTDYQKQAYKATGIQKYGFNDKNADIYAQIMTTDFSGQDFLDHKGEFAEAWGIDVNQLEDQSSALIALLQKQAKEEAQARESAYNEEEDADLQAHNKRLQYIADENAARQKAARDALKEDIARQEAWKEYERTGNQEYVEEYLEAYLNLEDGDDWEEILAGIKKTHGIDQNSEIPEDNGAGGDGAGSDDTKKEKTAPETTVPPIERRGYDNQELPKFTYGTEIMDPETAALQYAQERSDSAIYSPLESYFINGVYDENSKISTSVSMEQLRIFSEGMRKKGWTDKQLLELLPQTYTRSDGGTRTDAMLAMGISDYSNYEAWLKEGGDASAQAAASIAKYGSSDLINQMLENWDTISESAQDALLTNLKDFTDIDMDKFMSVYGGTRENRAGYLVSNPDALRRYVEVADQAAKQVDGLSSARGDVQDIISKSEDNLNYGVAQYGFTGWLKDNVGYINNAQDVYNALSAKKARADKDQGEALNEYEQDMLALTTKLVESGNGEMEADSLIDLTVYDSQISALEEQLNSYAPMLSTIQSTYSGMLSSLQSSCDAQITGLQTQINGLLSTIASLQGQIGNSGGGNGGKTVGGGEVGSDAAGAHIPAYAAGLHKTAPAGMALTGEEGPEIVWNKYKGYAYITGEKHPEFQDLKPGDEVFTAQETKQILGSHAMGGFISAAGGYGHALISGFDLSRRASSGDDGGEDDPLKNIDRYHVLKQEIQALSAEYDKLDIIKQKAFGPEKLAYLKQETELMKKQANEVKEYYQAAMEYAYSDLEKLKEAAKNAGVELQLDEDGTILNYEELWVKMQLESNQENKKLVANYESSIKEMQDKYKEYLNYLVKIREAALEEITTTIKQETTIWEQRNALLDYYVEKYSEVPEKMAQSVQAIGAMSKNLLNNISAYRQGILDILSNENMSGLSEDEMQRLLSGNMTDQELIDKGFSDAEISQINDYIQSMLNDSKDYLDKYKDALSIVSDGFANFAKDLEKSTQKIADATSMLQSLQSITELYGLDNLGIVSQTLQDMNDLITRGTLEGAKASKAAYQAQEAARLKAEQALLQATQSGDAAAIQSAKDALETINDQVDQAYSKWVQDTASAAQNLQSQFQKAVQIITDELSAALSPLYGSLDYLSSMFEKQSTLNKDYVSDYEKLYQLSKLQRDITGAIDDTTNVAAKQELNKLLKEAQELQESGVQLSEHDLDVLNKRFELEKARLALQEAKNAKSTVRLARNANGSWGYVYTADEDNVAKAEQEYEDKLHALQEANANYIDDLQSQIISLQQEMVQSIQEVYNDTSLTDEQRATRVAELQNYYSQQLQYLGDELTKSLQSQADTYETTLDRYKVSNAELVDSWDELVLSQATGFSSITDLVSTTIGQFNTAIDQAEEKRRQLASSLTELNLGGMVSAESIALNGRIDQGVQETAETIEEFSSNLISAIEALEKTFSTQDLLEAASILAQAENTSAALINAQAQIVGVQLDNTPGAYGRNVSLTYDYDALANRFERVLTDYISSAGLDDTIRSAFMDVVATASDRLPDSQEEEAAWWYNWAKDNMQALGANVGTITRVINDIYQEQGRDTATDIIEGLVRQTFLRNS